jgi:predicted DCC family thiol-disulfide oxidoreductase YuxK
VRDDAPQVTRRLAPYLTLMTTASDPAAARIVYYDGGCPVCRREIDVYRRMAGDDLAFVDICERPEAPAPDLDREAALARFHVRDGRGELVSGARAFLAMWRSVPRLAWLARLLSVPPLPWLLEGAYRGFLVLRRLWR